MTRTKLSAFVAAMLLSTQLSSADSLHKSEIMTEDQLSILIEKKAKQYESVVSPDDQISTKKFYLSPIDYVNKTVTLRAKCATGLGPRAKLIDFYPPGSKPIPIANVHPTTQIFNSKLIEEGCLLIGHVSTLPNRNNAPIPDIFIDAYMLCSIVSDTKNKKAELTCYTRVAP